MVEITNIFSKCTQYLFQVICFYSHRGSRGGYSPYIEDIEYAADIDEYAEGDDYFDENSSWSSEREMNQSHPGKIRAGTLV